MYRLGSIQKKILLLVLGGVTVGLSQSPTQSFRIIGLVRKEWKKITKSSAERALQKLYQSGLVDLILQKDGTWKMVLTQKGKTQTLYYDIDNMSIKKPQRWDKKWRVVIYDIPEKKKAARDALRSWMNRLGFYKLQASVFVLPYECRNEFDFMVEFLNLRRFVRFVVATEIDNENHLKGVFLLR